MPFRCFWMPHKVAWSVGLQIRLPLSLLRCTVSGIDHEMCKMADCTHRKASLCYLAFFGYYVSVRAWDERRQMMCSVNLQPCCGFSRNVIQSDRCCVHLAHCWISADTFLKNTDWSSVYKSRGGISWQTQAGAKCKLKSIHPVCLVIPSQIRSVLWFISAANGDKRPPGMEI